MPDRMPTEEEWEEWKTHPCTRRLKRWAEGAREVLKEQWASGHFTAGFDIEMAVKNSAATGACSIYEEIIELDYKLVILGASDEEQVRVDPARTSSDR